VTSHSMPAGYPPGRRRLTRVLLLTCAVVLAVTSLWLGLTLGGRRGPSVADTASAIFAGCTVSTTARQLESAETSRHFARYAVEVDKQPIGSAIVVSLPNNGAKGLVGRTLRAPSELSLCVVIDRVGVVRSADVLGLGSAVPGVSSTRRSSAAWVGHSVFELVQGEHSGVSEAGEMLRDIMVDLGRTVVLADYGDAVLARCEVPRVGDPVALRVGDFLPAVEALSITGERVNLASLLGHPSLLMNCDPFCGTCFDMTVDLFARVSQAGDAPESMFVLMQASADSERGKLLLASLPKEVTVVEDPDNSVAKSMGMNVSAFAIVSDAGGRVAWSHRINGEVNILQAMSSLASMQTGGS
jgi:hypothetical protein